MTDPAREPSPDDRLRPLVQRLELMALSRPLQWVLTVVALMVVAMAGVLLTAAWGAGPEVALRHRAYAHLTASADARVVDSWLALELDPARVRSPDNWRASARASPCVVVEMEGDWTAGRSKAFCGNRFAFGDGYDVVTLNQLAPGVPFAWQRDERGFAIPQIRLSAAAREYLRSHAVDTFMHRAWPARTALEWLTLELDRPVDAAVIGWTAANTTMKVAYDPAHAEVMLPAGIVASRQAVRASWIIPMVLAGIGLALWIVGMQLLPALANFNLAGRVVMTVGPLLALPWWADYLPRGLAAFNAPIAEMAEDMLADVDPLDRLYATPPEGATLAHGERITWRAGDGVYAETFGRFRFDRPAMPIASADEALAALTRNVSAQMRARSPEDQARVLDAWRHDKKVDLVAAGIVGVPAAREALIDPRSDARVRSAARAFLLEWTTSPTDEPDPRRPAFEQRWAIQESLADVPVPEIANMVRHR